MTITKDVLPLYKSLVSIHKGTLYGGDTATFIRSLTMYTILRSRYKNRDWNIYHNDKTSRFIVTDGDIYASTYGAKNVIGMALVCTYDMFINYTWYNVDVNIQPLSLLEPGADIDSIIATNYTGGDLWLRNKVMSYKMSRVAKIIFEEIPPCNNRNKKRSNYREDIDFLF
jgi:hypothetical protein